MVKLRARASNAPCIEKSLALSVQARPEKAGKSYLEGKHRYRRRGNPGAANININYACCDLEPSTNAPLVFFGVPEGGKAARLPEQDAALLRSLRVRGIL